MLHRRSTTRVALGPRRRPTAPISARRRGHRAQSAARVHTATRPHRDRIDKTPKTTSPRRNPSPTPCARRTRRAASRPRASRRRPRSLRGRKSRAHASSIIRSIESRRARETGVAGAGAGARGAHDGSIDRSRSSRDEAPTHRIRARRRDGSAVSRTDAFSRRGAEGRRAPRTW